MSFRTMKTMLLLFIIAATMLNLVNYKFSAYYNPTTLYTDTHGNREEKDLLTVLSRTTASSTPQTSNEDSEQTIQDLISPCDKKYENDLVYVEKNDVKICPEIPPGLGPISYNAIMFQRQLANKYTEILSGGIHKVQQCKTLHRAAIIVPFPGTKKPIKFIKYLHSFLSKQQLEYQVFVVEQSSTRPYNHGRLVNAAFKEINRRYIFPCFIVHDPTIVPVDMRNLYRCSWYPRQLATIVQKADKSFSTYENTFGGAVAVSHEQYVKVNGFSNLYWNNKADFEDMFKRLITANYTVERTSPTFGKYITVNDLESPIGQSSEEAQIDSLLYQQDGLSSLSYNVNEFVLRDDYTYINISLSEDPLELEEVTLAVEMWSVLKSIVQEPTI